MKISTINKIMGLIGVVGVTVASTASMIIIHEPKRPSALK